MGGGEDADGRGGLRFIFHYFVWGLYCGRFWSFCNGPLKTRRRSRLSARWRHGFLFFRAARRAYDKCARIAPRQIDISYTRGHGAPGRRRAYAVNIYAYVYFILCVVRLHRAAGRPAKRGNDNNNNNNWEVTAVIRTHAYRVGRPTTTVCCWDYVFCAGINSLNLGRSNGFCDLKKMIHPLVINAWGFFWRGNDFK